MTPFLQQVADDLNNRFPEGFEKVTLVFPNRRASLFFNHYLAGRIQKPIWAPRTVTVTDLMLEASGLRLTDPILLVSLLYRSYCEVTKSVESFDDFYFWGEVMLTDFDQIDKHLVDAAQLFSNVKDMKEIEARFDFLSPEQRQALSDYLGIYDLDSELSKKHLGIWEKLGAIYTHFRQNLIKSGQCYEGLAYRVASETAGRLSSLLASSQAVAFIGFNALSGSEHKLFTIARQSGIALFYWDVIGYLQPSHEANVAISDNAKRYPNALKTNGTDGVTHLPQVTLVSAPNAVSQAKLLPQILQEISESPEDIGIKTAIVLPGENLLLPVLRAIPERFGNLNVTIGYPLRETAAYGLAEQLVRLQMNARTEADGSVVFYYRNVVALLNHPYLRMCDSETTRNLQRSIKSDNIIYPSDTFLARSEFLRGVFRKVEGAVALCSYMLDVCLVVSEKMMVRTEETEDATSTINAEFLTALYRSVNRLKSMISSFGFEIGHRVLFQLLRKAFSQERVSFEGEPLSGIQVMGFLETRVLDFENLIVLSFNDDLLPGKTNYVSFITPSLRIAFGLPVHKSNEAIYAYHFFRLLARAKNVYLVYSSRTEGLSSGELSRFALQLQLEYMPRSVRKFDANFNLSLTPVSPITVEKTQQVMGNLVERLSQKHGSLTLSPSGLIAYITCPLRFYFRYVAGISETDEVTEEVDTVQFGKIIHSTIDQLYRPLCGKDVTASELNDILNNNRLLEQTLDDALHEHFTRWQKGATRSVLTGRNMLIRNALLYLVKRIVEVDASRAPFYLVAHEYQAGFMVSASVNGQPREVRISGSIDRLEGGSGKYTVIDFKTGSSANKGKFQGIASLFSQETIGKTKEIFQIFCYSQAVTEQLKPNAIQPIIWFVRSVFPGEMPAVSLSDGKAKTNVDNYLPFSLEFKQMLGAMVTSIFSSNEPFTQTLHAENCRTCPYKGICNR